VTKTYLTAITEELNKKTENPWVKNPKWISKETETIINAGDFNWTYFQLERTKSPALDFQGVIKVYVKVGEVLRTVEVRRAGHCGICHSTTHSKHGCGWPRYARTLDISYWYKDKEGKNS